MDRRTLLVLVIIAAAALAVAAMLVATRDASSDTAATPSMPAGDTTTTAAGSPPDQSTATSTSVDPTTSSTLPVEPDLPADACAPYTSITTVGSVASAALVETSGIAASRTNPGILWGHNDSRDGARVYAIGPDGSDLGGFDIAGAFAFDWEDMAAGPGSDPATSNLFFGDIGDNFSIRGGRITVYRVPEPDPEGLEGPITGATALEFEYPDGVYNAEALFVADQSIYVVTKDRDEARVYRGSSDGNGSGVETLELVAILTLGAEVSGADISWDGRTISLRGYDTIWMWRKAAGATVADALSAEPCEAPSPDEVQGEAIAFLPDGEYQTVSEGAFPDVFLVPFEA